MKIVVLDGYTVNPGDLNWNALGSFGELTVYDRTSLTDETEVIRRIGDAQIVCTNKTPITRKVIEACPNMEYIGVLATGYNVVDCDCARERGIPVTNVPGYGTAAVGQFTIGLLLEICHHIGHHNDSVHRGDWTNCADFCYWHYPLIELSGKTMGIIGFGKIGRATARIAKAMGMRILATGSRPTEEGRAIADYVDMDTLLAESDVISLHCPLFPETKGIINAESIGKMKDGVIILNTGRGPLIEEQDLYEALESGKVAAAAMDVMSSEPVKADNILLKAKNCIITPHIAWASKECRQRIVDCTVENVKAYLAGAPVNVVNP